MYKLLRKFEKWLRRERDYDAAIEDLLYKEWDGAYPTSLIGDDVLVDIENFLYDMAQFAVEQAFGKNVDRNLNMLILIIPYGSYDDCSCVYVLEMKTRTVLASFEEKTWHFKPDVLEDSLNDLVRQLEEAKKLLAVRVVTDS